MELQWESLEGLIGVFIWTLSRIGAFVATSPVIGGKLLPKRVKLILSIFITLVVINTQKNIPTVPVLSIDSYLIVLNQVIIGIACGLVLQVVFHIFVLLGQIVAMQFGLGFAVLNDPSTRNQVPMVGQMYTTLISLIFLSMDGHLSIIATIAGSFDILPLGLQSISYEGLKTIPHLGTWMFANGFKIALPAITALLMVNMGFGVMTRAAPQLNIFSIGFPITMILGICIIWLNLGIILPHFISIFNEGVGSVGSLLEGANNV